MNSSSESVFPSQSTLDDVKRSLPNRVDVVIVGAGIVGIATAFELARSGRSVLICEKGRVAGEQSSRAFGWICNLSIDPIKMELTQRSKHMWHEMAQQIGPKRLDYRQCGLMHLCRSKQELADEERWLNAVVDHDVDARLLSAAEISAHQAGNSNRYAGALYQASDARVEPEKATQTLADLVRGLGVRIIAPCAVRGIETRAGAVEAVVTEHGRVVCEQVVVAGGNWSRLFCGNAGVQLPQLPIHSSLVRIAPVPGGPQHCSATHHYAFRRDERGGYVIGTPGGHQAQITLDSFKLLFNYLPVLKRQFGNLKLSLGQAFLDDFRRARRWPLEGLSPFEAERVLNPLPDVAGNLRTLANMIKDFPALRDATVEAHWAGIIDTTPDSLPVISPVDAVSGLYINSGYSGYGLTMSLAAGELLADLMIGRETKIDPRPYRHSRFSDGSKLRIAV